MRPHRWQPTRLPSLGFSRQEYWSGVPLPSLHTLSLGPHFPFCVCVCACACVSSSVPQPTPSVWLHSWIASPGWQNGHQYLLLMSSPGGNSEFLFWQFPPEFRGFTPFGLVLTPGIPDHWHGSRKSCGINRLIPPHYQGFVPCPQSRLSC